MKKKNGGNKNNNPELLRGKNSLATKDGVNDKTVKKVIADKNKQLKKTAVKSVQAAKGEQTRVPKQTEFDAKKYQAQQKKVGEQKSQNVKNRNAKEEANLVKAKQAATPKKQGVIAKGIGKLKAKFTKPKTEKTATKEATKSNKGISKLKSTNAKTQKLPKAKAPVKKTPPKGKGR